MFSPNAIAQLTEALKTTLNEKGEPLGEFHANLVVRRTANLLRETGATPAEADRIAERWLNAIKNYQPQSDTRSMTAKELLRAAAKSNTATPVPLTRADHQYDDIADL